MHDNLSSHKCTKVYDAIYSRGHHVICRPPYRPNEAPIGWVFNQVACEIRRRWEVIKDKDDLDKEIWNILESRVGLGGCNKLFIDCDYNFDG